MPHTLEILSAQVAVINIKKNSHTVAADDLKNKYSGRSFFEVAGKGTTSVLCMLVNNIHMRCG